MWHKNPQNQQLNLLRTVGDHIFLSPGDCYSSQLPITVPCSELLKFIFPHTLSLKWSPTRDYQQNLYAFHDYDTLQRDPSLTPI